MSAGVTNRPVDLIATRLSSSLVRPVLNEEDLDNDVVWVTAGIDKQALILSRRNAYGELSLRYQPITNLTQDANGQIHFSLVDWQAGFPLQIFEDPNLAITVSDRAGWLSKWHTDTEWLRALHRTHYSNGLVGLQEELAKHPNIRLSLDEAGLSDDDRLVRRFQTSARPGRTRHPHRE